MSVWIRRPALKGLDCGVVSVARRREAVSRGVGAPDFEEDGGGGDGAIVFDLNVDVEMGHLSTWNDIGVSACCLALCSSNAAAVAALHSADASPDGVALLLSLYRGLAFLDDSGLDIAGREGGLKEGRLCRLSREL
jgi:hypothetical protein